MITAPFNFVPLNEKVFYPDWSEQVSHDIPFSDGESGVIDITITAKSPMFIRNHYQEGDKFYTDKEGNKISKEFCHIKNSDGSKQYYLPASSLKGMVRSTLEIISYGKIIIDNDKHSQYLSVRDMTNKTLVATSQKCGFLVKQNNNYIIQDCGKVLTISYNEIKKANGEWLKDIENVKTKYNKIKDIFIKFKKDKKIMNVRGKKIPKQIAIYSNISENIGQLVFTNKINNKKNEFIFKENGNELELNKNILLNFKKVYFEDENSEIGQYWKGKNKIPIFYTTNQQGKITAIGLTQIFKLAYNKTILEASVQDIEDGRLDLPETILGVKADEGRGLKGRVYFSHFKSNIIKFEKKQKEVEQVLGSPKPTYYPSYITQTDTRGDIVNRYITLMDENATIRGFKQYPLQSKIQSYKLPINDKGEINHDVTSKFKPLDSGIVFTGKIRFHNLKKSEIGALISAITLHGQNKTHFHNIGMAKSLGYGKIKIDITLSDRLIYSKEEYLNTFEELMNSWDKKDYQNWIEASRILEFFSMKDSTKEREFRYQQLENEQGQNDFVGAKKSKEYLLPYSGSPIQKSKSTQLQQAKKNNKVTPPKVEVKRKLSRGKIRIVKKASEK